MGRPQTLTDDQVLARATDLLWRKGVDAVSTRDLEAAIGLRAPALYRRFPNKHALLAAAIDFYVATVIAGRIERKLDRATDPLQGLHDFFTTTLDPHRGEERLRGCLLANSAAHADAQVPEVLEAIQRGWDMTCQAFQRQIVRAQAAGQLDPALDPLATSQLLQMSLQGLLTLVRAGRADLRPGIDLTFRLLGASR
jgi:TetR/AcrR family transcriptional repressor of nem operon